MNDFLTILDAREEKEIFQTRLLETNSTVVSIQLNTPGFPKSHDGDESVLHLVYVLVSSVLYYFSLESEWIKKKSALGTIYYLLIHSASKVDLYALKEKLCFIEDISPWGRIIDIDLLTKREKISRSHLKKMERTCLLCNAPFNECVKLKKHETSLLREAYFNHVSSALQLNGFQSISTLAHQSLYEEVSLTPKPGLVTRDGCGSNRDMSFQLFLKSSDAISTYFNNFLTLYLMNDSDPLFFLRQIGIFSEKKMNQVTGGVNTQKGLIFLFGVLLTSIGYVGGHLLRVDHLITQIQTISKNLQNDFNKKNKTPQTHGLSIYKKYGIRGARGFAMDGMLLSFEAAFLIHDWILCGISRDKANKLALLFIMSKNDDTNILWRTKTMDMLNHVKQMSYTLFNKGLQRKAPIDDEILRMNDYFIKNNINPGGSADILAVSIFLEKLIAQGILKGEFHV